MRIINVEINNEKLELVINDSDTLLEVLRREGYYGVRFGCGEGECGACLVLLDGKPVNSCMILAIRVNNRKIMTVEGLGTPLNPHPIQRAFVDAGAVQCGYSTAGSIISTYALLKENPDPTEEEIRKALDGNLCRCTGYVKKIEAVKLAAKYMKEAKK